MLEDNVNDLYNELFDLKVDFSVTYKSQWNEMEFIIDYKKIS